MEEELEILESIYIGDDLNIVRLDEQADVSIKCTPRSEDHFVFLILSLHLTKNYPIEPPVISIPDTFGIDESETTKLLTQLKVLIDEAEGESICFTLVEFVIDLLEKLNDEACCHICLSPLLEKSPTVHNLPPALTQIKCLTTPCRHQYHSACLLFWWRECVVSKHRALLRKGGEEVAVGREREATARQKVLEQTREAAILEVSTSTTMLTSLQQRFDAFNKQPQHKLSRSEAAARETEESEIKNELNMANQRVEAANSALEKAVDRVEKSAVTLESAHQLAAAASDQHESKLVSEIPCPVCRSTLKLEDTPIDINRFMKNTKKMLAEEDRGGAASS